jgi:hypothetical protein
MGYLNKETVTVDAILTKKGRELLSRGRSAFNITQFAIADDEIDYGLYDPAHPLGSEYYGASIENMPIVEASPDETQNLRYKLVTLARGQNTIPLVSNVPTSIALQYSTITDIFQEITPRTTNNLNSLPFGYTAILFDREAADLTSDNTVGSDATIPAYISNLSNTAIVVRGTKFTIRPKDVDTVTETRLTIIGNQTGATATAVITITPATTL